MIDSAPDSLSETLKNLRDEGFSPIGAADARQGLSKMSKQRFDAIITDTRLRGEPIAILFRSLERDEANRDIPILVYSEFEEDFAGLRTNPPIAPTFLKKPMNPAELGKLLREKIRIRSSHVNVDFINPVLAATVHTISTMTSLQVKHGKPYMKKPGAVSGDICGIIPVESRGFNGTIAICFEEQVFMKVISKILGMEFKQLDDSMKREVGELINIIFGQTRHRMEEMHLETRMALPAPVIQPGYSIPQGPGRPCLAIDFAIQDLGTFKIEMCIGNRI